MIKFFLLEGHYCPRIYCDECNQPIDEASKGAVIWDVFVEGESPTQIYHVHKGECLRKAERKFQRRPWWNPLRMHLAQLVFNTGMTSSDMAGAIMHPLLDVVVNAFRNNKCHDKITLCEYLLSAGSCPESKDVTRMRKAYAIVAQHLLESALEEDVLYRDERGWYRIKRFETAE